MKGVILRGGLGTRLKPLTSIQNKHLLPIYDKQMVRYPIDTLVQSDITDIMIVCGKEHAGHFISLLGDGSEFGANITYGVQKHSTGIADALNVVKPYIGDDDMCVILGDNIIQDNISPIIENFNKQSGDSKCHVVCKPVDIKNAKHYGVLSDDGATINIIEKPENPVSNLVVIGMYLYSSDVFDKINKLKPSERGELEVTDLNNLYSIDNSLEYSIINGYWYDCGISIDDMTEISYKLMNDLNQ